MTASKHSLEGKDSLSKRNVANGFKLLLSDSTYKIIRFDIVFGQGDLVVISNKGNQLSVEGRHYKKYFEKIDTKSILTVENITISKENKYYRIRPLLYYTLD